MFSFACFTTGSKRVYAGDFSRGYCINQRFQPFVFWTNGSVSDCIYAKSICSEKGQVVYNDNSSTDDRVCGCDYKKSYAFIQKPINNCYCIPTEEECSCYIKSCPENYTLSSGISFNSSFSVKSHVHFLHVLSKCNNSNLTSKQTERIETIVTLISWFVHFPKKMIELNLVLILLKLSLVSDLFSLKICQYVNMFVASI